MPRLNGKRIVILTNGVKKTGYLHAKELIWTLTLCHVQKINSKWIKDINV